MKKVANNRTEDRSNVFLAATLHDGNGSTPVRIRNISARGALVDGTKFPAPGTKVRLVRGRLTASGEIAWRENEMAGLNFDSQIEVGGWVQRVGHGGQQRIDKAVAALRRSGTIPRQAKAGEPEMSVAAISLDLDEICRRLAGVSNMSLELAEELFKLDALAQSLRRLARK